MGKYRDLQRPFAAGLLGVIVIGRLALATDQRSVTVSNPSLNGVAR